MLPNVFPNSMTRAIRTVSPSILWFISGFKYIRYALFGIVANYSGHVFQTVLTTSRFGFITIGKETESNEKEQTELLGRIQGTSCA